MQRLLFSAILFSALAFGACSSEESESTDADNTTVSTDDNSAALTDQEKMLVGSWKLDEFQLAKMDQMISGLEAMGDTAALNRAKRDLDQQIDVLKSGSSFEIRADHTCTMTMTFDKDADQITGTWMLSEDGTSLTLESPKAPTSVSTISGVTAQRFTMVNDDSGETMTLTWAK